MMVIEQLKVIELVEVDEKILVVEIVYVEYLLRVGLFYEDVYFFYDFFEDEYVKVYCKVDWCFMFMLMVLYLIVNFDW